jgi:hypothetical protein
MRTMGSQFAHVGGTTFQEKQLLRLWLQLADKRPFLAVPSLLSLEGTGAER